MSKPSTADNAEPSETKKCICGEAAVGVISTGFAHKYVCRKHAKEEEKNGFFVDYGNWRL
jgi:hypothetical protein